jgi:hypothetical protein
MSNQESLNRIRESEIYHPKDINRDDYPCLQNLSPAFTFRFLPIPNENKSPEFVFVNFDNQKEFNTIEVSGLITYWNQAWESGHLRYSLFEEEFNKSFAWLSKYSDSNIYLIPYLKSNNYYAYQHLLNLIPAKTRIVNGLPLFKKGIWPSELNKWYLNDLLPSNFDYKLSNAFSFHIWPLLNNSSRINAFSDDDPIKLISHNLNYWVPYLNDLIEERLREHPRVEFQSEEEISEFNEIRSNIPDDMQIVKPRTGGMLWYGEDEAWEFSQALVEKADEKGRLREIIDAVKSHRIHDDFSDIWSYEREDFERKLYKKRNKYKVSFVELNETIPIQGPNSEVVDELVWEDFLALLDQKEKQITICIKNGYTNLSELGKDLGYANHSPVSKSLKRIRQKLLKYLE